MRDAVGAGEGRAAILRRQTPDATAGDAAVEDRLPAQVTAIGARLVGEQEVCGGESRSIGVDDRVVD